MTMWEEQHWNVRLKDIDVTLKQRFKNEAFCVFAMFLWHCSFYVTVFMTDVGNTNIVIPDPNTLFLYSH